ncbi:MAG: hypothetical protein FE048_03910 [Thermoplasmata archaeon]|nr:MAG: hypothetical protein FE048_03910 [Thermoplasmata archaeon]
MKCSLATKTRAFLKLIRPELCIMGLIGVFVGGIINGFEYASFNLFLAMIVVVLMTAGSMAFNDYFDWEIDKMIHPERPIPSGRLLPKESLWFAISSFFVALIFSFFINVVCFGIVVLSIGFLVLYEKFLKNQGLVGNIVVAFLSSMAFTFGGASVGQLHDALILSVMAFLLMLGREILMDVRDIKGDSLRRITLPMKIGKKYAIYLGCIFLAMTIALTPLPALWDILSVWYLIIIIPVDFLIAYAIILSIKDMQNTGRTTDIVRLGMALGLIGFVVGIIP